MNSSKKLSLNLLQRNKITNIIHSISKDCTTGQVIAGVRIAQAMEVAPAEIERYEYTTTFHDENARIEFKWNELGVTEKVDIELSPICILHLKKFLLTARYDGLSDAFWLADLLDQLEVSDEELQQF